MSDPWGPRRLRRLRPSTVVLIALFVAIAVLYLVVRPAPDGQETGGLLRALAGPTGEAAPAPWGPLDAPRGDEPGLPGPVRAATGGRAVAPTA